MSQTSIIPSKPTWVRWQYFLSLIVIGIIYVIIGIFSGKMLSLNPQLPIVWLPSGIMLAIVMIGGYRYVVGVALGVICLGLLREQTIFVTGAVALSNMMTIGIGAYLLKAVYRIDIGLKRIRDVVLLILLGGFGVMGLGSVAVTLITIIDYRTIEVSRQFLALWMGSSLSVMFITPLIFAWYSDRTVPHSWRMGLESIGLIVFSILLAWVSYSNILQLHTTTPTFYFMLPPITWAMVRFHLREVALVNTIMISFLLWSSQIPDSLVSHMLIHDRIFFIWSTIAIGSVVSLLVKVLIDERHTIEKTLKLERDFTIQILETLGQGVTVVSKTGEYEYVNPAFARLLDMETQELIGMSVYDIVADSFKPELDNIFKIRRAGKSSTFRATLKNFIDEEIVVLVTGVPRYIDNEQVGIISVVTDIRPLLEAEQARIKSEAFFQAIFQNSADSIVVIEKSGKIVMSNHAHQNLVGYSAEELSQMTVRDYVSEHDAVHGDILFQKALQNHEDSYQVELQYIHSDKTIRWVDISVGMVWDKEGNYQHTIAVSRDITESRKIKQTIETSEKRFRAIFENASLPIAVTREDRMIGMVNRAFCDMLGYSENELQHMRFDDLTYVDDNKENVSKYQQLVSREIDHFTLTKRYIHKDGSTVWANLSVSRFTGNITGEGGSNLYTIAIVENITERKLAEDRLKAEMQLNQQLIDALPGIFFLVDEDGNLLRWNKQLEKVSGYTDEEMKFVQTRDFFSPKFHTELDQAIQQVFEEGHSVEEALIMHRDGYVTPYLMNGYRIIVGDQLCLVGVGTDISNLKTTEAALRESEKQYRTIFENAVVGIYRSTVEGRFLSVNPEMVKILGYDTADELYALDIAQGIYVDSEKRGTLKWLRGIDGLDVILWTDIRMKKKNGDIIIASGRAKVIRDDDGNTLYSEGSMVDITEQYRQAEEIKQLNQDLERRVKERTKQLAKANERLLELDRLRAKFIADMSHEMRTPLTVLNTRLYLLQHTKSKDSLEQHIEGFRIQLDRLEKFVENAFDISVIDMSRDNLTFEDISLNRITEDVIKALAPRAEVHGLDLSYQLDPTLPHIMGVENHLSQVITNLIGNAIKYTEVGQVQVTTGMDSITNRVYLRVEDTGMGVAEEDMPHLFSRFYRGQRAGQSTISGTGLGLSIVKEIVDTHDGHIDIESRVNDGSVFTVWLPIEHKKYMDTHSTHDDTTATRDE